MTCTKIFDESFAGDRITIARFRPAPAIGAAIGFLGKPGKGWFKEALGMAICCAAPILVFAAILFFGLSLGAIASGALSDITLLACPVGMFLMMRMTMKDKKED